MRIATFVLLSSLAVASVACGSSKSRAAKEPEGNPWANYTGTYATSSGTPAAAHAEKSTKADAKPVAAAPAAAAPAAPAQDAAEAAAEAALAEANATPEPVEVAPAPKKAAKTAPKNAKKASGPKR